MYPLDVVLSSVETPATAHGRGSGQTVMIDDLKG
jgi:hypothetical protein